MSDQNTSPYEGMFLISQAVAADLNGAVDHIKEMLDRAGAEIIAMKKWDERRLAYEIEKQKRGVYILVYFNAPRDNITQLERDCNLSERIMRLMVLRADHLTLDEMQATDAREELKVEAKLRAEEAAAREAETASNVSLGAPPTEEETPAAPEAETPADEPEPTATEA